MELTHHFDVPAGAAAAWDVLTDIERIAGCMPGATIENVEGDTFTGSVKVKVGPMQLTYRGNARFVESDAAARTATIEAAGRETRGAGTAKATVRAQLEPADIGTHVTLVTDLAVTGRPAQFGRGVLNDVGKKLVDQFAAALAQDLRTGQPDMAEAVQPAQVRPSADVVDLVQVGLGPVVRRVAPMAVAAAVLALLVRRARRR